MEKVAKAQQKTVAIIIIIIIIITITITTIGRETDHSTPASGEVKKMWVYMSTPPYAFMA
jgi:hypothetical protein